MPTIQCSHQNHDGKTRCPFCRYTAAGHLIRTYVSPYETYDVVVVFSRYIPGRRTAIQLVDSNTGEPVAMATVNLPDEPMAANEIAVKNYAENEGMYDWMIAQGFIEPVHRVVRSGYVDIPICRLRVAKDECIPVETKL